MELKLSPTPSISSEWTLELSDPQGRKLTLRGPSEPSSWRDWPALSGRSEHDPDHPQMRILLAVGPVDFRKGIDGLAAVCRQALVARSDEWGPLRVPFPSRHRLEDDCL
ncbi:MAG: hypothetical protein H7A45_06270 [Verrucomicrobiales bacterium]|nr:hypothetical protein [Verrucomicrobiales bacterium]